MENEFSSSYWEVQVVFWFVLSTVYCISFPFKNLKLKEIVDRVKEEKESTNTK